jgi:putative aldouronate transport system permease protein
MISAAYVQPPRTNRIKEPRGDRVLVFAIYVLLVAVIVAIMVPLVYIVASSFSSPQAISQGSVWLWPVHFTTLGYRIVLEYPAIWTGFFNSAIYTIAGTSLTVALTALMAFPLSRKGLYGYKFFIWLLLGALLFNGGLIPFYLVVNTLHLNNTRLALIIPGALNVFWVMIARAYFIQAIPQELYDAAEVDGCGGVRFFWSIVLPLSKPILAVVALLSVLIQWNSYFYALIFLNSPNLYPLQLVMREILLLGNINNGAINVNTTALQTYAALQTSMKYSLIVVGSLPILLIYPLAQRYFMKGIMIGSLKE